MKAIILGGFLGSGKTSIILQLAKYVTETTHTSDKTSTVIIENEIGETGIDDKVLASQGFEVKNLNAGCICCTMVSDLALF